MGVQVLPSSLTSFDVPYDRQQLEDIGFMTCMTLTAARQLCADRALSAARWPTRLTTWRCIWPGPSWAACATITAAPNIPIATNSCWLAGHCVPTCYALWMILGAGARHANTRRPATGATTSIPRSRCLPIDALGFRRGAGAMKTILQDNGLADLPLFAQAKARGIHALAGHAESTDLTNDVNGGPSGVGIATGGGQSRLLGFRRRARRRP